MFGGGRRSFFPHETADVEYNTTSNLRLDGRDLVQVKKENNTSHLKYKPFFTRNCNLVRFQDWLDKHDELQTNHAYVWNKEQMDAIDSENTDFVLGKQRYTC